MSEEAEVPSTSPDPVSDNLEKLRDIFPEAVTEDGIDVEVLLQLLGEDVAEGDEKYGLNWHGKRRARQLALTPSAGTLRPCPEDGVDWDTTKNLMIEGDNLEVLKLLQKPYAGKIKLIYIDPPYNTGKDFVYPDNFKDSIGNYLTLTGQVDEEGNRMSSNTESSGRFHTDWLNMMYPRLKLARELLSQDGAILVSIDQREAARLVDVLGEVFGEEQSVSQLVWISGRTSASHFTDSHEYVIAFARNKTALEHFKFRDAETVSDRAIKKPSQKNPVSEIRFPAGIDFESEDKVFPKYLGSAEPVEVVRGTFEARGGSLAEEVTLSAAWSMKSMIERWLAGEQVVDQKGQIVQRFYFGPNGVLQYEKEKGTVHPRSIIEGSGLTTKSGSNEVERLLKPGCFSYPKPLQLITSFVEWFTYDDDLVLDFFAGSGTTGHAVMAQNAEDGGDRRYILVQLPEPLDPENKDQKVAAEYCDELGKPRTIAELTKERLRRAAKKVQEENPDFGGDLGFRVFKLDSSNIRAWDPRPDDLEESLEDSVVTLKGDRDEQDVLYEVLLKLGLDLCVPIETREIAGVEVHSIGAGTLFACLAEELNADTVEEAALGILSWRDEIDPAGETTCLFRDSAFPGNVAKTNLTAILEQGGIETVRSL